MIHKSFLLLTFLVAFSLSAQQIFIKTGVNNTSYDFKAPGSSAINLRAASGNFYEVGFQNSFRDSKLSFLASITINQFNANASNGATSYSWRTSYLGVQNMLSYVLFSKKGKFDIALKAGLNTATIVKGEQFINTTFYDIKNQEEFSGIVLQPVIGLNATYKVSEALLVSLGYNFSTAYNVSNSSEEKIAFSTNQIQFGLHFPLK